MKIRIAFMLGIISIGVLSGCRPSTNRMDSSLAEPDADNTTNDNGTYFAGLNVEYTTNDDGTYTCRDNIYKYMIEVSGIEVEGKPPVTYIILTNDTETSFKEVRYNLIKAEISPENPKFIILGWY